MTTYRCWACRTATDDEGDCRNPHCPTLRGGDRLRHLTREQLREIDRTINRAEPRSKSAGGHYPTGERPMTETDIARLTRERDEARERAAGLSRELLAAMHRLRDLVAAEARFAEAEEVLREIADECDCDFPRCQSTIARAALGEEGK